MPLPGSDRPLPPGSRAVGLAPPDEILAVTIVLYGAHRQTVTGGRPPGKADGLRGLRAFAKAHQLTLVPTLVKHGNITLRGTSANLSKAFGVTRTKYTSSLGTFYGHPGAVHIPRHLSSIIEGVIGLNQFPVRRINSATPTRLRTGRRGVPSFHPVQMARLYNFPEQFDGSGQTIALIELGGGFRMSELRNYFRKQRLRMPRISVVSVDRARNKPGTGSKAADLEVQGDIETLGSLAPGARIVVYFAPMTERGLYDAVVKAVHDRRHSPAVISISFGEVEMFWPPRTLQLLDDVLRDAALMGITVCCAAGDAGSSCGVSGGKPHVYFPASSPHVLSCGGTQLKTRGDTIVAERVWRAGRRATTGGGVSRLFARPPWQANANVPRSPNKKLKHGRGLPDVAANAADYLLVADGQDIVIGGTSAVAPLWAGLIARINQKRGHPVGFVTPVLYGMYDSLRRFGAIREVTEGSNGSYRARKGWNPCAGLGCPDGVRLTRHLAPDR